VYLDDDFNSRMMRAGALGYIMKRRVSTNCPKPFVGLQPPGILSNPFLKACLHQVQKSCIFRVPIHSKHQDRIGMHP